MILYRLVTDEEFRKEFINQNTVKEDSDEKSQFFNEEELILVEAFVNEMEKTNKN